MYVCEMTDERLFPYGIKIVIEFFLCFDWPIEIAAIVNIIVNQFETLFEHGAHLIRLGKSNCLIAYKLF